MKYWCLSALTSVFLSSCYSVSVAGQYLCLLSKGKDLSRVGEPGEQERLLFARVARIKAFAQEELGLRPTKNYSRYVRLNRDYLTLVVSAAPELSFEDYRWNYPFVGKLPYRGYFDTAGAKKEAKKLKERGYDVFVRPVDAFSTLGYVRDPLFSYMAEYSEARLADLIIHESFHATLFVRGDIGFNESLANLVGKYGSRIYMERYGEKALMESGQAQAEQEESEQSAAKQDAQQFRSMVFQLKEDLNKIYQDEQLRREQKLDRKNETIAEWQQQFQQPEYSRHFRGERYLYMAEFPINNAYLALFSLYEDPDNFLDNIYRRLLEEEQGNRTAALHRFIALCRKLGKKHGPQTREALREYWETEGITTLDHP
ncbi:aminopeptidase [Candidatus Haliotispira prima]|uniref:Aminopeptidase n=1 Tax=Candidatus Haliotispira prima TaxID=3034016 RepID=A0ABY8MJF5_9SPIO|nr:aminopeptidase [Candidatus Haliotispira prima]